MHTSCEPRPCRASQKKAASTAVRQKRKQGSTGELCDCEDVIIACTRKLGGDCDDYASVERCYDDAGACAK